MHESPPKCNANFSKREGNLICKEKPKKYGPRIERNSKTNLTQEHYFLILAIWINDDYKALPYNHPIQG